MFYFNQVTMAKNKSLYEFVLVIFKSLQLEEIRGQLAEFCKIRNMNLKIECLKPVVHTESVLISLRSGALFARRVSSRVATDDFRARTRTRASPTLLPQGK